MIQERIGRLVLGTASHRRLLRTSAWSIVLAASAAFVGWQATPEDAAALAGQSRAALAQIDGTMTVAGLEQPVDVIRDTWGVPHIYARTEHDLFFAQGYVAAQDRLWQLDLWRRSADGTLAEVVGPSAVRRDTFARLLRYRGDLDAEWASYGPGAKGIVEAFVDGVNAQISYVNGHPDKLPIEFRLLDARPKPWTPDVVISRMAGYLMARNVRSEIQRARLTTTAGAARVSEFMPVTPPTSITVPEGVDLSAIPSDVLDLASDASETIRFPGPLRGLADPPPAFGWIGPAALHAQDVWAEAGQTTGPDVGETWQDEAWRIGSNNWVIAGSLTDTGKPILANDPHRVIALPSLRYTVHLVGPGWNVIGAGEPALPGIAAGHNDRIAFGFTIVGIDQQDVYVERLDPSRPDHYVYKGVSEPMVVERTRIAVRGGDPKDVDLRFTKHGPVLYLDTDHQRAYVLRWVGTEPGTAGYLRSIALDRARNWTEFRGVVAGWKVPSENLMYADVDGNIGWIAAGLAPIRPNWNGLLPVPGDAGQFEWAGFLGIDDLPQAYNPVSGYIATANHNILPPGYTKVLGYEWGSPFRFNRITEVISRARTDGRKLTVADSERLQHDATSLVARAVCDGLRTAKAARGGVDTTSTPERTRAVAMLTAWDHVLGKDSAAAALFELWAPRLSGRLLALVPAADRPYVGASLPTDRLLRMVAGARTDPAVQDALLGDALDQAWQDATRAMGSNPSTWAWGRIHRAYWEHPLAGTAARRDVFNLPDVPRGGDANAPFATGTGSHQTHGASFREVIDLADWDRSMTINVPGASAQPGSRFYGNLLPIWAAEQYHPMPYSRAAVEANAAARLALVPARR
ncbi:MAG TPA: penicillin acylase family protein [Vicinamibacterales bacterium]|jgi:penicillin amidase